jgi:hypothetical protein
MTKRLLLTARDPAAVGHVVVLFKYLSSDYEIVVAASGAAKSILLEKGIGCISFEMANGNDYIRTNEDSKPLLNAARTLLKQTNPDAIIASLSSFGAGIDEAVIATATAPNFAVQDFWGDVNLNLGVPASLYFVMDEFAAEISSQKWNVNCFITGSIRHAAYADLDILALRQKGRKIAGADDEIKLIGWFGQTFKVPGYADTVESFKHGLTNLPQKTLLIYRGHPKFSEDHNIELGMLTDATTSFYNATNIGSNELWLCSCDLIATPFSLCGLDHAYLSFHSSKPIGSVVYIMTNKAIRSFVEKDYGFVGFPTLRMGLGEIVFSPGNISKKVLYHLSSDAIASYYLMSKRMAINNPVKKVDECLKSLF